MSTISEDSRTINWSIDNIDLPSNIYNLNPVESDALDDSIESQNKLLLRDNPSNPNSAVEVVPTVVIIGEEESIL